MITFNEKDFNLREITIRTNELLQAKGKTISDYELYLWGVAETHTDHHIAVSDEFMKEAIEEYLKDKPEMLGLIVQVRSVGDVYSLGFHKKLRENIDLCARLTIFTVTFLKKLADSGLIE